MDLIGEFQTTQYKRGGSNIKTGCDCYGLWEVWLKTLFGINSHMRTGNGDPIDFYKNYKKHEQSYTALDKPVNHSLVLMYTTGRKRRFVGHCGVYWNGQVVQMEEGSGCYAPMYSKLKAEQRLVGQYLHPQLAMLK